MIYSLIAGLIAAADLAVKEHVERNRTRYPRSVHNRGFARNRMEDRPGVVSAVSVAGTAGIAAALVLSEPGTALPIPGAARKALPWLTEGLSAGPDLGKLGLALMLGGAVSNTADRLFRKYVVDYIPIGKYVYNLGDLSIYAGILAAAAAAVTDANQK